MGEQDDLRSGSSNADARQEASAFNAPPLGLARCHLCPSRSVRISRLRLQDLVHILTFQFPVRCSRCGQRQYTTPLIAAIAGRHKIMKGPRKRAPEVSWASFTEVSPEEEGKLRPMTTVIGPRARNLGTYIKQQESPHRPAPPDDTI